MGDPEKKIDFSPTQKTLIVVAGPTAVGKTNLAIKLARYYNSSILSADSRQFYKEMSIGTAKPTPDELAQAKHHFINSHSITEEFNVGDFEKQGLKLLDELFTDNSIAILAGGSGLYIKAICEGFDELPPVDINIREHLNSAYQQNGLIWLQEQLQIADPEYYSQVDINNPQRIIRALEVTKATGKPFSAYRTALVRQRHFNIIKIGLNLPRELLYHQINQRVNQMVNQGLINEVQSLLPYRHLNSLNTVGYKELFEYLDGKVNLDDAIALIKQNTRRFAKRQLTWFNKDKDFAWFTPTQVPQIITYIDALLVPAK
jgi:tRNA dimethylallyltransferase